MLLFICSVIVLFKRQNKQILPYTVGTGVLDCPFVFQKTNASLFNYFLSFNFPFCIDFYTVCCYNKAKE